MLRGRDSAASAARSPKRPLSRSASAALSAAVRADRSAPGSFFSMSIVPSRTALRSSSSSQRALSSSSSEGASRGSGARAAMSESVMRESAPSSRSRRRQPETAAAVTPASAARSAARSPASSRATSSIFLSKGKYTAFLRGGGATPAAFAQFTTAVRLQPASSAASVRLNPAATASTASSLVSNGYMRTPIRTPECPTFCPHPQNLLCAEKSAIVRVFHSRKLARSHFSLHQRQKTRFESRVVAISCLNASSLMSQLNWRRRRDSNPRHREHR